MALARLSPVFGPKTGSSWFGKPDVPGSKPEVLGLENRRFRIPVKFPFQFCVDLPKFVEIRRKIIKMQNQFQ